MSESYLVAGVDEAGRGPLAGPVIAAAVILNLEVPIHGLRDSKLLSARRREHLAREIRAGALAWAIGRADSDEIDTVNILQASLCAMQRAIAALPVLPQLALVDGNQVPELPCPARPEIRGDTRIAAISAASILAKVSRDREMLDLDRDFPGYGFAPHKGYPTREHLAALRILGPCAAHRRSFAPVRDVLRDKDRKVTG